MLREQKETVGLGKTGPKLPPEREGNSRASLTEAGIDWKLSSRALPVSGGEHGGRHGKDGSRAEPSNVRPTLADAGIDKKLSSRAPGLGWGLFFCVCGHAPTRHRLPALGLALDAAPGAPGRGSTWRAVSRHHPE